MSYLAYKQKSYKEFLQEILSLYKKYSHENRKYGYLCFFLEEVKTSNPNYLERLKNSIKDDIETTKDITLIGVFFKNGWGNLPREESVAHYLSLLINKEATRQYTMKKIRQAKANAKAKGKGES